MKQFGYILCCYAYAIVLYLNYKTLLIVVVLSLDIYLATLSKLYGVFHQVYKYLLQTSLITKQ